MGQVILPPRCQKKILKMDGGGKDIPVVVVSMFADEIDPAWSRGKYLGPGPIHLEEKFF
jgi:hypothetical protein